MDLRLVFLGTPEFAVPSLEALVRWRRDSIVGVISQQDKPQGRHRQVFETPVKRAARRHDLPVFQPLRIRTPEARALLERLAPDLVVVVAYGQILPKWFLDLPRFGAVNVHASLLPRYRGAAPLQRAILQGEQSTGITLMLMDEGMDTGPVLSRMELAILEEETAGELAARAGVLAADFLARELPCYLQGLRPPVPQDSSLATYAPLLKKDDGLIRFELPGRQVHNLVRALNPWPVAQCRCQGAPLLVHRASALAGGAGTGMPGELAGFHEESMLVACGQGLVALRQVQAPGRKVVSGREFANGLRLGRGFRFENG